MIAPAVRHLCRTVAQQSGSSVGAAYSDVAPTELIYLVTFFYKDFAPLELEKDKCATTLNAPRQAAPADVSAV
jgi:hypothetical protein